MKKYKITLEGRTYEVEVEHGKAMVTAEYEAFVPAAAPAPTAAPAPVADTPAPAAAPVVTGSGEVISAPMPGTVLQIKVTNGQAVKKGDVLVVLEAMKMENEITSPCDGTVTQVAATLGATVDTGAPLVVIG